MDKKRIESKSGEGVVILYDFVATNICEYFLLNKVNNKRLNISYNGTKSKKIPNKKTNSKIQKNVSNNANTINQNKNYNIKFNIIKFEDNSTFQNGLKKIDIADDK